MQTKKSHFWKKATFWAIDTQNAYNSESSAAKQKLKTYSESSLHKLYFCISWHTQNFDFIMSKISLELTNIVRFCITVGIPVWGLLCTYSTVQCTHADFLHVWICSNILHVFSGCRRPIFKCFTIIRFIFALAFQCRIPNCSTAKTREDRMKRIRKVKNDGAAFLHDLDSFKHITRFLWGL